MGESAEVGWMSASGPSRLKIGEGDPVLLLILWQRK